MARRGFSEARDLFWLLTRTDATIFPELTAYNSVELFIKQSLKAYWDVFVNRELRMTHTVKASNDVARNAGPQGYKDALYDPMVFSYVAADGSRYDVIGITGAYRLVDPDAVAGDDDFERSVPIERVEFDEMRRRQLADTSTGTIEAWSAVRGDPELTAPSSSTSNNIWSIYVHPKQVVDVDASLYITFRASIDPPVWASNTAEVANLTDAEFFWVVQMAAARAALSVGRMDDVPLIVQGIPDAVLLRAAIDIREALPEMSEVSSG